MVYRILGTEQRLQSLQRRLHAGIPYGVSPLITGSVNRSENHGDIKLLARGRTAVQDSRAIVASVLAPIAIEHLQDSLCIRTAKARLFHIPPPIAAGLQPARALLQGFCGNTQRVVMVSFLFFPYIKGWCAPT